MYLIEPCCAPKQLLELRKKLSDKGTVFWHACGDLSLEEFLKALLPHYSEAEMIIAAPSIPDAAVESIMYAMRRQHARIDGSGNMDAIKHLTIVSDLRPQKSPIASRWLAVPPLGDRLTVRNVQQADTAIIMPDIAFLGPINLTYGRHFTAVATKNAETIASLRSLYSKM